MRYEIYLSAHYIGREPYRRVVAECDSVKDARAICEALKDLYVPHVHWRDKLESFQNSEKRT